MGDLRYLTSTSAPASLSFFSMSSASVLLHAGLDVLGRAVDEVLGVLETEARDLADDLDDADLVGAAALEDDGELGLLLGRLPPAPPPPAGGRRNGDRSRLDAPLVLEGLRERRRAR